MKLSICYSFFLSLISIVFSATGIYALRIATIPVSDMVKDQFENFIVLSLNYSISYTFLFQPALKHVEWLKVVPDLLPSLERIKYGDGYFAGAVLTVYLKLTWLAIFLAFILSFKDHRIFMLLGFIAYAISLLGNVVKLISLLYKFRHTIKGEFMTGFTRGLLEAPLAGFYRDLMVSPLGALCWLLLQCVFLLYFHLNFPVDSYVLSLMVIMGYFYMLSLFSLKIVPDLKKVIAISTMAAYAYEHGRIIEIVCGTLATILAQYYFRIQSVALMFAFLSLATAWLGILGNVHPCTDFGIFQFLVAASLQLAVNIFGLHFYTFLITLGAIILMVLRWKMESLDILKLLSRWEMESVSVRRPAV